MGKERQGKRPASCLGWSGRLLFLAAERPPILQVPPAYLRHAAWRQAVFVGHVRGPLVQHQVADDAAVSVGAGLEPAREVNLERSGIGRRGDRVVAETFLETVLGLLAKRDGV